MIDAGVQHVLVVSDTHVMDAARIPSAVFELAARADHIIHAGDHSCMEVVHVLRACAPVTAVQGNVEDATTASELPITATVTVSRVTFGIVHDPGPSRGRDERLAQRLPACSVRVYGHTHEPDIRQLVDGSWVINPGSPTQRRRAPSHTVCWLTLAKGAVVGAEIVHI